MDSSLLSNLPCATLCRSFSRTHCEVVLNPQECLLSAAQLDEIVDQPPGYPLTGHNVPRFTGYGGFTVLPTSAGFRLSHSGYIPGSQSAVLIGDDGDGYAYSILVNVGEFDKIGGSLYQIVRKAIDCVVDDLWPGSTVPPGGGLIGTSGGSIGLNTFPGVAVDPGSPFWIGSCPVQPTDPPPPPITSCAAVTELGKARCDARSDCMWITHPSRCEDGKSCMDANYWRPNFPNLDDNGIPKTLSSNLCDSYYGTSGAYCKKDLESSKTDRCCLQMCGECPLLETDISSGTCVQAAIAEDAISDVGLIDASIRRVPNMLRDFATGAVADVDSITDMPKLYCFDAVGEDSAENDVQPSSVGEVCSPVSVLCNTSRDS